MGGMPNSSCKRAEKGNCDNGVTYCIRAGSDAIKICSTLMLSVRCSNTILTDHVLENICTYVPTTYSIDGSSHWFSLAQLHYRITCHYTSMWLCLFDWFCCLLYEGLIDFPASLYGYRHAEDRWCMSVTLESTRYSLKWRGCTACNCVPALQKVQC